MSEQNKPSRPDAQRLIDENLKRVYADVQSEELPDRFKDLLSQLKKQDSARRADQ